jgi:hypothetical protein
MDHAILILDGSVLRWNATFRWTEILRLGLAAFPGFGRRGSTPRPFKTICWVS